MVSESLRKMINKTSYGSLYLSRYAATWVAPKFRENETEIKLDLDGLLFSFTHKAHFSVSRDSLERHSLWIQGLVAAMPAWVASVDIDAWLPRYAQILVDDLPLVTFDLGLYGLPPGSSTNLNAKSLRGSDYMYLHTKGIWLEYDYSE